MMEEYDVVIIGSGLGGLSCGTMLAKDGYKVCVLDRNKQIGGTLQTYVRDRIIFDSGVHYVGGLSEGQNLNQIFKYLGIMHKLKLQKMNEDGFDGMMFGDDPKIYWHAQGYDNFIKTLVQEFPEEEKAIQAYCDGIREVCSKFPLYNLQLGDYLDKISVLGIEAKAYIDSLTSNKTLRNVLAGNNILYAGVPGKTPFYVHALVVNSYIESSYRFIDGGSQIARLLTKEIRNRGGVVLKRKNVNRIVEEGGEIKYVETDTGERFFGKTFISSIHPQKTMEMTDSSIIKKAYRSRLQNMENSISIFCVSVVLKKDRIKYEDRNYYYFTKNDVWSALNYTPETWPTGYALYFSASSKNEEYADGISVMAYMNYADVEKWADTFNTALHENSRGEEYDAFKKEYAEKLFACVENRFPGFTESIENYYVSTPLTLRDYMGTDDGSIYGVVKDYREPLRTFISPRTKIPNLLLTGQNLNLHGILGVSVSSIVTCSEIIGHEKLITKIQNA